MAVDQEHLEVLLNAEESATLDHKAEQYPFAKVDDEQKSELLKDILAMADAWKTSDAHVVIGAKENPGSRATVLGIADHIDDARLQQFVNQKTNVHIDFAYEATVVDGKKSAVITVVANQHRPIWLKKDFGRLRARVVYIRRGSSTDEANPDEIARMGEARAGRGVLASQIEVGFGAPGNEGKPAIAYDITSTLLKRPAPPPPSSSAESDDLFSLRVPMPHLGALRVMRAGPSEEEVYDWRRQMALLRPITFQTRNVGGSLVSDVRLHLRIPKGRGVVVCDEDDLPEEPRGPAIRIPTTLAPDASVEEYDDHWLVRLRMGKLQPGSTSWSDKVYVGAEERAEVPIDVRAYGDQLSAPIEERLSLRIATTEELYAGESDADDEPWC